MNESRPRLLAGVASFAMVVALLSASPAAAQTNTTWRTNAGNASWNASANWSNGVPPESAATFNVFFTTWSSTATITGTNLGMYWNNISFSGQQSFTLATLGGNYVMYGTSLSVAGGSGAIQLGATGSSNHIFQLYSASPITIANNSSGLLSLPNVVSYGGATAGTRNVTFTGSGDISAYALAFRNSSGANGAVDMNVIKSGAGTLTVSGSGNSYPATAASPTPKLYGGTTTINAGTLQIGVGGTTGAIGIGALALGGGRLVLNRSDAATQSFASTTLNAGLSAVQANANNTIDFGAITRNAGASLNIPTTGSFITSSANTNGILGGITFGGTTWAVANGASAISGLSSYTLASTAGSTAANYTNANIDVDASQSPSGAIAANSLRFNTAAATTLTLTGSNTMPNGILVTANVGSNLSTITGGTLAGSSGRDLVVIQNNTTNGLTIASLVADNVSATALTKSGSGTLTLSAANSYTGGTQLNAGTLQIGGGGTTGSLSASSVITGLSGATLAFNRSDNYGGDFANSIGGAIGISQLGTGTLTLTAANTYTGATSVTAGTLEIASTGRINSTTGVVINGGQFKYNSATALTQPITFTAGTLSGTGTINTAVAVANGATLAGSGQFGGLVTVASGGILAPGNSPGTLTMNSGLLLDAGSLLNFELSATDFTAGAGVNDLINVTGDFTLAGILNVAAISGDFSEVADYTTWRLFNYSGGTFVDNGLTLGTVPSVGSTGKYFQIDTTTAGQVNLVIVPEPGAMVLASIGAWLAGWSILSRRRMKTAGKAP